MACNTSFELHHNFPKLAEDAGFTFNAHRPKVHIDWNKIRLLDVDSLMRERKFVLIEQHLYDILDCVLDSEFDLRILDEGVVKMFRLAQLTVEYQQFCRHYLDRSIFVLKEELTSVMQELEDLKKNVKHKDDEVKKIKRRYKHNTKQSPFFYGNDNIANAILKTLSHRPNIFPSNAEVDASLQYNKCKHCEKVFMNQLYLKSHMDRRHPDLVDLPVKSNASSPQKQSDKEENSKLQLEIQELKEKLKALENNIESQLKLSHSTTVFENNDHHNKIIETKTVKDAEVTANESNLLDDLEDWKRKEHTKLNEEIISLRQQIMTGIQSIREQTPTVDNTQSNIIIQQLHKTITDQGRQIDELKQQLSVTNKIQLNDSENKSMKDQLQICAKKIDAQTKQCEALLENLKNVAEQAQNARELAEAEAKRADNLEAELHKHLLNKPKFVHSIGNNTEENKLDEFKTNTTQSVKNTNRKDEHLTKRKKSLKDLHRKAQELLNIVSSSSDVSSDEVLPIKPKIVTPPSNLVTTSKSVQDAKLTRLKNKALKRSQKPSTGAKSASPLENHKHVYLKEKSKSYPNLIEGNRTTSSPQRILRTKITEEVHKALVEAGIDPLMNRVKTPAFDRIIKKLHKNQSSKIKGNSTYERVRHSLLAFLDSKVSEGDRPLNSISKQTHNVALPSKPVKLKTMFSSMKNKALDFVKEHRRTEIPSNSDLTTIEQTHKDKGPLHINTNESSSEEENTDESSIIDHAISVKQSKNTIEELIKSPIRKPSDLNGITNDANKTTISSKSSPQSHKFSSNLNDKILSNENHSHLLSTSYSDNIMVTHNEDTLDKNIVDENVQLGPKGVLKNAPSTSSLNKKKVIFDMDAIQMKSLSASPSQSNTDKSDANENYELGLVNLDDEEWDISSIENGPIKADSKGLKVSELKQVIEGQLENRSKPPSAVMVGGVDVLRGSLTTLRAAASSGGAAGGSNTSLGSSLLDPSDDEPRPKRQSFIKQHTEKDDSELDISEFSLDEAVKKNSF